MIVLKTFLNQSVLLFCAGIILVNHGNAGAVTLTDLWAKALTINSEVRRIFPDFHFYRFDDYSNPVDSIKDGGSDLFDEGNKVSFYEGNDGTGNHLAYGNTYNFDSSSLQVGRSTYPFMALAWIQNQPNITESYTIQIGGSLGAGGSGKIEIFDGNVTIDEEDTSAYLEYHTFQVYDAQPLKPTLCEVYFAISNKDWNSVFPQSSLNVLMFSNQTDHLSNAVRITGHIQNVVFGFILLSTNDGNVISNQRIEEFLKVLMLRLIDDDSSPTVPPTGICGETIYLNDTAVKTLSSQYWSHINDEICEINIQGSFGYKIEAVINMDLDNLEYLQIKDKKNIIWGFGGRVSNVRVSTLNDLMKLEHYSSSSTIGFHPEISRFNVTYHQYMSTCGEVLWSSNTASAITVAGSPKNTLSDVNCYWVIKRHGFSIISFTINNLVIGDNGFLQVTDQLKELKRFETSISKPVTLYGYELGIRYRGDLNAKGTLFSAMYQIYRCRAYYRLKKGQTSASVRPFSRNFIPNKAYDCIWYFYAQPHHNLVVKLEFKAKTSLSYVTVFADNTQAAGMTAEYNHSSAYISVIGLMRLDFSLYPIKEAPEIKVTYKQIKLDCKTLLSSTAVPQIIRRLTKQASDCVWTIQGAYINLTINSLVIKDGDYVEVFDGPSQMRIFNESLTSIETLVTRTSLEMKIFYHTSSISGTRHLSATYQKVNCDETYMLSSTSSYIVKQQFPSYLYKDTTTVYQTRYPLICNLYVEAQDKHLIEMTINQQHNKVFNLQTNVYENRTLIGSLQSGITINVISNEQKLHLQMTLLGLGIDKLFDISNIDIGLTATFKQFKPTTRKSLLASPIKQNIPSPEYLTTDTSVDCVWVIIPSTDRYVQLFIEELDIDDGDGYLEVIGSLTKLKKIQHKLTTPTMFISNVANDNFNFFNSGIKKMTVYLHSGSQNGLKRFTASYKEVTCGETIVTSRTKNDKYLAIPEYNQNADGYFRNGQTNITCDYVFLSRQDDWLTMEVEDGDDAPCCNYVQIFKDNVLIKTKNDKTSASILATTGSQIRLHFVSNNTQYRPYLYNVFYRRFSRTCGSFLTANAAEQHITSPGYPGNYGSDQDCIWMIRANHQQTIRFIITTLNVGTNEYLKITEGLETSETYEEIIISPVTFSSSQDTIIVHFHSESNDQHKGFKGTFVAEGGPQLQ